MDGKPRWTETTPHSDAIYVLPASLANPQLGIPEYLCSREVEAMSTLSNVLGHMENLIGDLPDLGRPIDWPRTAIRKHLQRAILPRDFNPWHDLQIDWTQKQAKNKALEQLICRFAKSFRPATTQMGHLVAMTRNSRPITLPRRFKSDRHLVILGMKHIYLTFKAFCVVKDVEDFQSHDVKNMVLGYLRKAYRAMIVLGQLLCPHRAEAGWFEGCQEYLYTSQLTDFRFDLSPKQRIEVRATTRVVGDQERLPERYISAYPESPIFHEATGRYGPNIMRNVTYEERNIVEPSFTSWPIETAASFPSCTDTVYEEPALEDKLQNPSDILGSASHSQRRGTELSQTFEDTGNADFHKTGMQQIASPHQDFAETHAYQSLYQAQASGTISGDMDNFASGGFLIPTGNFNPWVAPSWDLDWQPNWNWNQNWGMLYSQPKSPPHLVHS